MPRFKPLLNCLGLALCEKARKAFIGDARFVDVYADVVRTTYEHLRKEVTSDEIRDGLQEMIQLEPQDFAQHLIDVVEGISRVHAIRSRAQFTEYLASFPAVVRRVLSRPSDPTGQSVPENITFTKPEDLYLFLPGRLPRVSLDSNLEKLDGWQVSHLMGYGEVCESWIGTNPELDEQEMGLLKFIVDEEAAQAVHTQQDLFVKAFDLSDVNGIVPLRTVFLENDPPCLESPFISGYHLGGLMWDWKWNYATTRPDAALKLMRRLCEIVGKAHAKGIVHRDLKPSNILLHPTEGGKFSMWISDFGWGQISALRSLELERKTTPRSEQHRLALRGAHSTLYACPQLSKKEAPEPTDDIFSLGMIWYQLLRRSPTAPAPIGNDWVEELHSAGVTDSQARLLNSCLSTRPDRRPANANAMLELLANVETASGKYLAPSKASAGSASHVVLGGPTSGKMNLSTLMPPLSTKTSSGVPQLITNSIGMSLKLIPSGSFLMGSPKEEPGRRDHEGPQHAVKLTRRTYLGIHPVQQGEYEQIMGKNPSAFTRAHHGGNEHPVENVTWHDAAKFCELLSRQPAEAEHGRVYRLPTEAEWEYACRAGSRAAFACGEKLTPQDAHFASARAYGKSGGHGHTASVGSYSANSFGLYDMHGNVAEWVQDWYDEYYYHESPDADPQGPTDGTLKVTRGGCWSMFPNELRSATRRPHDPGSRSNTIGFRVLLEIPGL